MGLLLGAADGAGVDGGGRGGGGPGGRDGTPTPSPGKGDWAPPSELAVLLDGNILHKFEYFIFSACCQGFGSGSVFGILIRIRIQEGKNDPRKKKKMKKFQGFF